MPTVRLAKADVVPTEANLRSAYGSFVELEGACEEFCAKVNGRVHRESARIPAEALLDERVRLHVLPAAPHTLALGQTRTVNTDQTVRYGSVRHSTPSGLVGAEIWVRVAGTELALVADLDAPSCRPEWAGERRGLLEVARHRLSTPGTPRIDLAPTPIIRRTPAGRRACRGHGPATATRPPGPCAARPPGCPPGRRSSPGARTAAASWSHAVGAGDPGGVQRAANLAISGPSGRGKTHYVGAAAHMVIDAGMRVSWFPLESLTAAIGKAAVDRLLHHAHVLITEGTSLRLAEATAGRGVVPLN